MLAWYKSLCLVGSNAAFILPSVVAFRDTMYYEALVFFTMFVVSSLYHVLDSGYHVNLGLKYSVYAKLDFYCAFSLISRTTLMVVFNTGTSATVTERSVNTQIKMVSNFFLDTIALALVLEDVETPIFVGILAGLCMCFVAASYYRTKLYLDLYDLVLGWVFIGIGCVCFFMCGDCVNYWIFHSVWHTLVAIGIFLMVESKNKAWNLIDCIGRYGMKCLIGVCCCVWCQQCECKHCDHESPVPKSRNKMTV